MLDIEKLDNELYNACYGIPKKGNIKEIWSKIKSNQEILREAVKVVRNKWNNGDLVKGLTICESMLIDYSNVDQIAYNQLIQAIYTNPDIARIVVDGAINHGSFSYLLMSLWNHNIKLTKEQKDFAVAEAMNKIGIIKYQKAKSNSQAHGTGKFDIRYQILRNPNWTVEEKQKLIMDFYDDETYDEYLDAWEWEVVNDSANYKGNLTPSFDRCELFSVYTYEMLLAYYQNKEVTDRIWSEIQFCKQMHQLRPQQWELESSKIKQLV